MQNLADASKQLPVRIQDLEKAVNNYRRKVFINNIVWWVCFLLGSICGCLIMKYFGF
jgi:hypothetical protein